MAIGYEEEKFNLNIMKCEIEEGIHRFRRRSPTAKVAIKFSFSEDLSFF